MPRYVYNCELCGGYFQVWHGMKETQESCQICSKNTDLVRVPQMPSIKKTKIQKNKTGDLVKDYIKENEKLLKDMKKEARSQTYDD